MKIHYGTCECAFLNALKDLRDYVATITTADGTSRDVLVQAVDDTRAESVIIGELMSEDTMVSTHERIEININDIDLVEL